MIHQLAASFIDTSPLPNTGASTGNLTIVVNIILGTMGAVAFFMLVLAGFRYAASGGQPDKVSAAKQTITYSIVGLVVIALAGTIVNFVVGKT